MAVLPQILPLYTLYYYNDFLYKVVKFKRSSSSSALRELKEEPSERFASSYSRSRSMVLQYALCNQWDYFVTITVDPVKFDRYELDPIYDSLYAFFKAYRSNLFSSFRFLLVPEYHEDRAWHFHGLLAGIRPCDLFDFVKGIHPWKLVSRGYLNWPMLADAVGYVSLSRLNNSFGAAFYVTKYITKEHANDSFYSHLYYHSRGLSRAKPVADCYMSNYHLNQCLTYDGMFCASGWLKLNTPDFALPFSFPGCLPRSEESLDLIDEVSLEVEPVLLADTFELVQLTIDDWRCT